MTFRKDLIPEYNRVVRSSLALVLLSIWMINVYRIVSECIHRLASFGLRTEEAELLRSCFFSGVISRLGRGCDSTAIKLGLSEEELTEVTSEVNEDDKF